jgi:hypothetical protein
MLMQLLIFQTYVFALIALVVNFYLWSIEWGKAELSKLNNGNKPLLNDAHWMPRKTKPSPTNVVVLLEGIHQPKPPADDKPADQAAAHPHVSIDALNHDYIGSKPVKWHDPSDPAAHSGSDKATASSPAVAVTVENGAAEEAPAKSTATGAYVDKNGKYMDVADLLKSKEVQTFKKLKWGGGSVLLYRGLVSISNGNSKAWTEHVNFIDRWLNIVYPICCTISVGCILGFQDLAGLGSAPMPTIGLADQ